MSARISTRPAFSTRSPHRERRRRRGVPRAAAVAAKQLDGELGRIRRRAAGSCHRRSSSTRRWQLQLSAKNAFRRDARRVHRATVEGHSGNWAERARTIAVQEVAPALDRQIAELRAQRLVATDDAGISSRPHGEVHRWALKASTTTTMSPDGVHELGQSELKRLQAEMDAILKAIGYTQGSWANG
jgi:uncharacterized protein (DUF885 family)